MRQLTALFVLSFVVACSDDSSSGAPNHPPVLSAIDDQQAVVEQPFALLLSASDPDGNAITYSFKSDHDLGKRASIEKGSNNRATFKWNPIVSDIGIHVFDFIASDGSAEDKVTVTIEVTGEQALSAPVFLKPLGTGTTIDLSKSDSVSVPILIRDLDTAGVTISEIEPVIEGGNLAQSSELEATWSWQPSEAQLSASDRYLLKLSADDGDNPATTKDYLIVLRIPPKMGCPGEAPVVQHDSPSELGQPSVQIVVNVTDDKGIKYEPLLYFSTTDPGEEPDITQMTQVSMTLDSGDMSNGVWRADVANPAYDLAEGKSTTLYYVVEAVDNDDAEGTCDHLTRAPQSASFSVKVTHQAQTVGLDPCEPCQSDDLCGGKNDHCIVIAGAQRCSQTCSSNSDCPNNWSCPTDPVISVDGEVSRQCMPPQNSCEPVMTCVDDIYEENDTLAQAQQSEGLLADEVYDLVSCPGASAASFDDDYYRIEFPTSGELLAILEGGSSTDLDLALLDSQGSLIAISEAANASEEIAICVESGTYYLRVQSFGQERNPYSLTYGKGSGNCAPTCSDDPDEDDDTDATARNIDLDAGPYESQTNAICPNDEDWYALILYAGETLEVKVTFDQTSPAEDLDIRLYRGSQDLIGCTELDPSGCTNNGQSTDSDEYMTYEIPESDVYYVVVHGWDGASNLYDICISVNGSCL